MAQDNSHMLIPPSAKKRSSLNREYPFPIVTLGCQEDGIDPNWKCIEGYLQNDYVLVHDDESIEMLYKMGYFGKGTLSKNVPKVCSMKRKKVAKEPEKLPVQESSRDEDIIDVIDSDDESSKLKLEKDSDDVEVVLSVSSSSSSDEDPSTSKNDDSAKNSNTSEKESLQLTLEEAYFLSYGLGCLIVKDKDQPMNLARLWNKFCELTPDDNFPVKYTAYHHFRSKGWVVKSGIKFGVDYVLYKDGPPFYHATYSVIVKPVKEQNLRDARGNIQLTWASLAALNRVNANAGKALMFLYVIKPSTMSDNKISTPFCISQYKLEEVLYKRWVPSENREETDK